MLDAGGAVDGPGLTEVLPEAGDPGTDAEDEGREVDPVFDAAGPLVGLVPGAGDTGTEAV